MCPPLRLKVKTGGLGFQTFLFTARHLPVTGTRTIKCNLLYLAGHPEAEVEAVWLKVVAYKDNSDGIGAFVKRRKHGDS